MKCFSSILLPIALASSAFAHGFVSMLTIDVKCFSSILLPIALASSAFAHGFVSMLTIDGQAYKGNTPSGARNASIIRQINTTSPVMGALNPELNCGPGAGPASNVADALPGSQLAFTWSSNQNLSNWFHNIGPLMTYMASCGNVTCDQFNSTQAQWFKIDEQGRINPDNYTWVQSNLNSGYPANVTLPTTLAPGNYLIRHEIIALHLANVFGKAEFYPSCSQFKVGGSQTGAPASSELVTFPGGYSDYDAGIWARTIFNNTSYAFPGPQIAAFASDNANSSFTATPTPTVTSPSTGSLNPLTVTVTTTVIAISRTGHGHRQGSCTYRRRPAASSRVTSVVTSSTAVALTSLGGSYTTSSTSVSSSTTATSTQGVSGRAVSRVMRGPINRRVCF